MKGSEEECRWSYYYYGNLRCRNTLLKEFIVWLTGNWYVRSLIWKLRRNREKLTSNRFMPLFSLSSMFWYNCYVRLNNNVRLLNNPCHNSITSRWSTKTKVSFNVNVENEKTRGIRFSCNNESRFVRASEDTKKSRYIPAWIISRALIRVRIYRQIYLWFNQYNPRLFFRCF